METTSRKYYEDKLREFNQYRRGRTLQQFCKDEGIDYKWMLRAKKEYTKKDNDTPDRSDEECPSLIQLHYENDEVGNDVSDTDHPKADKKQGWTVSNVVLTDPSGNEITISSGSAAALGNLLTKLASCHD